MSREPSMRLTQILRCTASAAVVGAVAFGFAGVASAQDGQQSTVDDIIVTAQKREQTLQDVPIVVTSLSAEALEDAGVKDIKDLQILTPGLTVTSTTSEASTTARIRGVGTVGDNPGLESSVGVVIDGVYRSRNGVGFGDLGELSRIEVLKGPQGTLFGKNTSAGVINIITEAPVLHAGLRRRVHRRQLRRPGRLGLGHRPDHRSARHAPVRRPPRPRRLLQRRYRRRPAHHDRRRQPATSAPSAASCCFCRTTRPRSA